MTRPTNAWIPLILCVLVLTTGCASTRSSGQADREAQDAERISRGIAAIAGESAGIGDTVTSKDVENEPNTSLEQLLTGRVAGVQVFKHPNGGFSVRIRGESSIMGGNEPLYVVDGMQVMHNTRQGLNWLNVNDIEKIEILKSASDTAIYGVRGSNGVVLITTKRGKGDSH